MAERESLSAQTERLAALLSKRRSGAAAMAVGTTPKVEAPPPVAAPAAAAPSPAPAPAPAPVSAPVGKPAAEPAPASASGGGDSLSMYFRALGLEDPFSGSDAGASASIEDLLAIQGERPAAPKPAPVPEPAPPAAPPPPPPAPEAAAPEAPEPPPPEPVAPVAPEPSPAPGSLAASVSALGSLVGAAAKAEAAHHAAEARSEAPKAEPPEAAIALGPSEPLREPAPAPVLQPTPVLQDESGGHEGDPGDFLDQVSFDDPTYAHVEPQRAPRDSFKASSAASAPEAAPSEPQLDDPAFWETPDLAEERAAADAAHKREYEAELAAFDPEPEAGDEGEDEDHGRREEPAEAQLSEDSYQEEEGEEQEEEAYAEEESSLLGEGEMLMPIDAQRAEMIRHLAQNMGCAPEDVVVTALDWYLDALMNSENGGDSDAA